MNIHEHQAKKILKDYGAPVSNGVVIFDLENLEQKIKTLKNGELVVKPKFTLAEEVKRVE
jgi:succinyl-CoA synthetase beta subunit